MDDQISALGQTAPGRLQGKVAVITGAGSGIGASTAERFHQEGARIVAVDISGRQAALAERLGPDCVAFQADVSKSTEVQAMLAEAMSRFGRLDILMNNAGVGGSHWPIVDYPEDEFDRVMSINCKSVFLGMKYAIPLLLQSGGGSIINTASMSSFVAFPQMSAYCASKGAVLMLTKTAAMEYARQGIRINAICPGPILTDMIAHLPPEAHERAIEANPMGRLADPREVANLALFLASGESSFITGTQVMIDGGLTAL